MTPFEERRTAFAEEMKALMEKYEIGLQPQILLVDVHNESKTTTGNNPEI